MPTSCLNSDALQQLGFDFAEEKSILPIIVGLVAPPENAAASQFWIN